AFEPAAMSYQRILLNFERNRLSAETVFPFGLTDTTGPTTFAFDTLIPGASSLPGIGGKEARGIRAGAFAYALDDLLRDLPSLPPPTHLKIDVDGHEPQVLAGAQASLRLPSLRHLVVETQDAFLRQLVPRLRALGFERVKPHAELFGNAFFERTGSASE
ncbi:MAG: FkbM family methyltransferase, partial [Holophagales bacterium]|nr:FkbM family methyltransferase [Holophagales bacterium]